MSVFPFDGRRGSILVDAEVTGPLRSVTLRLILDTGASTSLLSPDVAARVGIDAASSGRMVTIMTGSGIESAPQVVLTRFGALGQHRFGFPVVAHRLPAGAMVDGLLGLDYLRGLSVTLDFRAGQIVVA